MAVKTQQRESWMSVSIEDFAQQNAGRPKGHLVKELVQNSFDSLVDGQGNVTLNIRRVPNNMLLIDIRDNGSGIEDLENLTKMFFTGKKDSPLKRGRFGRGFKEIFSLAHRCLVFSTGGGKEFYIDGDQRLVRAAKYKGFDSDTFTTQINMYLPWDESVIPELESYFNTFLIPQGVRFIVNGFVRTPRDVEHTIEASLTTETFVNGMWTKRPRQTQIELVHVGAGEAPLIYEMGIPVCSAEWDQPYHLNVLQRVPMNPNRDAVMSGYPSRLHKACLPSLMEQMTPDEVKAPWVGEVIADMPEETQKDIITKGFGSNVVRSVPSMGSTSRDFDAEVTRSGANVIQTRHLTGGFRETFQQHVPSSRDVIVERENRALEIAAGAGFRLAAAYEDANAEAEQRRVLIERVGGRDRVNAVSELLRYLVNEMLHSEGDTVTGFKLAVLSGEAVMFDEEYNLVLALNSPTIWSGPMVEATLTQLVNAVAKQRARLHGMDVSTETRRLAGRLPAVIWAERQTILRLLERAG